MGKLYVGLSGYSYKPWQGEGRFYPIELKQKEFFRYYAERFNAVEMDGTWYRMPSEAGVESWLKEAPEGFRYTFKAHRNVSHVKRLKPECYDSLEFMVKRLEPLLKGGRVACLFIQLPPNMKKDEDRLQSFFCAAPKGVPYGIEFRNDTWKTDQVEQILRDHNVAWVSWDTDESDGERRDTGQFIYARMRRENYTDEQLRSWAGWFQSALDRGKDCFVFFKHEDEGSPWIDANRLLAIMKPG